MVLWVEGCDSINPSLLGFAALYANLRFAPLILQIPTVSVGWVECNETQQVTLQ